VAIVGRPNVGKSTLLNAMVGRRVSIVDPTAGTTRDRVTATVRVGRRAFEAVDTGGIGIVDEQDLALHVEEQIALAIERAVKIVFVVDALEGLTPLDIEVAKRLRKHKKTVILVANKCEKRSAASGVSEFYRLGFGDPLTLSAMTGVGVDALIDEIGTGLPLVKDEADEPELRIAIVGKRNAGKSTCVNALAREERVIVSDVPGTTRDAVDVAFDFEGKRYIAIDTAGLRKKKSLASGVEFYSSKRSEEAIRRADVVLLMFDCSEELSIVDKNLARYCADQFKPTILVANKWDLAQQKRLTIADYKAYLAEKLPNMAYCPVVAVSAKRGERVFGVLQLVDELQRQANVRVPTAEFNRVLDKATERSFPARGLLAKMFYGTQVGVSPPTFVLFVNETKLFGQNYERYLGNRFRESFECREVPLRIIFRKREKVSLPDAAEQVGRHRLLGVKPQSPAGRKGRP
jgi:GTP-binding protein